jgi:hypothetical protein
MKLCKDCKWCDPVKFYNPPWKYDEATCKHPSNRKKKVSLGDGSIEYNYIKNCKQLRKSSWWKFWLCGNKGRWFKISKENNSDK